MPKSGFPLSVDSIVLFELARGPGHGAHLLRRVRSSMGDGGIRFHYGTYYPALERLYERGLVCRKPPEKLPQGANRTRPTVLYALTQEGAKEARRLSAILHRLILPKDITT